MDTLIDWIVELLGLDDEADAGDKALGFPDPNS